MAEKEAKAIPAQEQPSAAPVTPVRDRSETVVPPNWAPNMLVYADIARMLFRLHRNVSAHMDAHKRLAQRMQSVFAHEQAMVLELARLIDESLAVAPRANEDRPRLGGDGVERIFDHARDAMRETGRMLTEMQLESLALLEQYLKEGTDGATAPPHKGTEKNE